MIYIYKCETCDKWWAVHSGQILRCSHCGSKERIHAATVDPAVVLTRFLNGEDIRKDLTRFANEKCPECGSHDVDRTYDDELQCWECGYDELRDK